MNNQPAYYGILPANVRYCPDLKPMEKIMFTEITALSNKDGYCSANNSYFAELYEADPKTVGRWIRNLEKFGFVEIDQDPLTGHNRKIYPRDKKVTPPVTKKSPPRDKKVPHNNTSSILQDEYSIVELGNSTAVSEDVEQEKIPYREIIEYLNEKTGKSFRHTTKATQRKIKARWNEGFTLEDFRLVIETKARDWAGNAKMSEYLRPDTLFGTKFEGYLQKAQVQPGADNSIEARIDCHLDEEQFNAYHAYHGHIREKFPNLFHYVPILTASEYLAIRPGGERWDGLRIHLLPRHIKEALNMAHRTIEDGLLNGKQYESVKAVLDHLLKIAAHA